MVQVGNRIIFDQDGDIVVQLGEMRGDVLPRKRITTLDYVDIEYGHIDYNKYKVVAIDTATRQPILEEIEREATPEEIIEDLQQQLKLLKGE